jgi:hypothetical protein
MNDRSTSKRAVPRLENSASLPNPTKIIFVRMLSCLIQLMRTAWAWERIREGLAPLLVQHKSLTQKELHVQVLTYFIYSRTISADNGSSDE